MLPMLNAYIRVLSAGDVTHKSMTCVEVLNGVVLLFAQLVLPVLLKINGTLNA
jgi:hypothetical protein